MGVLAMTCLGALAAGKVNFVVGGYEKRICLPAKLAEAPGYFKAEDVMLVGSVQGVIGFYDHWIDLQTKGKFFEFVVQFGQAPGEVFLVSDKHAGIKSVAQLRTKSVGATGWGSSTTY